MSKNQLGQKKATGAQIGYAAIITIIIGALAAFAISRIPGVGAITQYGITIVAVFLLANIWFTTVGMIPGAIAAVILWRLLSGLKTAQVLSGILNNQTIWMIIMVMPITYALRKSGATDYLAYKLMNLKMLKGNSTVFLFVFYFVCLLLQICRVNVLVILALGEGVMKAAGYEPRTKEHDAFMVGTFFARGVAGQLLPIGSIVPSTINGVEKAVGEPLSIALYIIFGIILNILLVIGIVFVLKVVFRIKFSKMENIDVSAIAAENGAKEVRLTRQARFMLIILVAMIVGQVVPLLIPNFVICSFIDKTLGAALFMGILCLLTMVYPCTEERTPVITPEEGLSKGFQWPMFLTLIVMLYFAGIISSEETGIQAAISGAMSSFFDGKPIAVILLFASVLCIIFTGFFSNVATALVFQAAILPMAKSLGFSTSVLGASIIWASWPGFLTPGGCASAPFLHGMDTITKKNMFKYLIAFLIMYLVMNIITGVVLSFAF